MYKYTLKDMCHVVMCHVRRLPLCIVGLCLKSPKPISTEKQAQENVKSP